MSVQATPVSQKRSGKIGLEVVSGEVADINARKRMNFLSNSVLDETPKFVDLGLSPAHKTDKLKSVIGQTTRSGEFKDNSDWIASRHRIAEVTEEKLSKVQAYSNYIKNSEFGTEDVFERENIQLNRQDQNIQLNRQDQNIKLTRQDQNIPLTRLNKNIAMTRLNENIPMTQLNENTPMTQLNENSPLTRPT